MSGPVSESRSSPRTPATTRLLRLLLVTADRETSAVLAQLGQNERTSLMIASTPDTARTMLAGSEVDVVVLESLSGVGDLQSLCREIRRMPAARPPAILAVVEDDHPDRVAAALAAGATEVTTRPIHGALLRHRLRSLARRIDRDGTSQRDELTRLHARGGFRRLLAERMAPAADLPSRRPVAVILLDIDRFKKINDSLGHAFGDRVLAEFARRLGRALGGPSAGRALGRYGGDEFAVMLGDLERVGDVAQAARHILDVLAQPLSVEGKEIFLTASVGAAVAPADGDSAESLLRNAETAMYAAKKAGRDTFRFYTDPMSASVERKFDLENRLRRALDREELELLYQPILHAKRQTLVGLEALLRWNQRGREPSGPDEFIPMAEETGLVVDIGEWVLHTACRQAKEWNRNAPSPVRVTVNVSHRQLRSRGFVSSVSRVLGDTGLDARLLELEITESSVVRNERETLTALHQLKVQGIRLAVDDFGTGHSALNYLKKFPLNTLKIDQSFTRGITTDADDAAIITATINMAHGLNMTVVAEGVELEEQLYFLSQNQCDEVQGFLFAEPLSVDEVTRRLHLPSWGPASS